ncbi:trans-sulfuration enzyme family protein [Rouxiella badensis]|jgi:methionine-gamma-lyase|uniref:Methionine gamma-lyase n=1 Tax=Rouxiella badensis TaxID=1646377 RepID=A0A1X0WA23_9GAMM|nr:PLP-dependent aspartate aminotransferase family protein [Rouxiella badensis]ORJ23626.1 methionine gamma-lyase [Rouxiella badensis]QOI56994.1 PLP-dependent transferase [Rouxiella badensis subsp. acadiensis]WAT05625.1 PLP-dependent aspartate aminotransferase family protein [Rouxiella badensis]WAT08312.1 PLP-dependent aspartate aminotransferase family protein [Rouxiella badensis]
MKKSGNHASLGMRTLAVHGGQHPDAQSGAITTPITATSSFSYGDFDSGERRFSGEEPGYMYSRFGNPTVTAFEERMAVLEDAESAVACASGMAAVSATLFALLKSGDEIIHIGALYGGTEGLIRNLLPRYGIKPVFVPDLDALKAAFTEKTKMVFVETPANPVMGILSLEEVARLCREAGAVSVVDNTFATPYLTRPLQLGIDVVLHSATKYISGHGDATGGVVAGRRELIDPIRTLCLKQFGGCLSPFEAALMTRGLKTLPLRVEASSHSAQKIAEYLNEHPAIAAVFYPGLKTHAGYEVARKQMKLFGGIMAVELKGGRGAARQFLDKLTLVTQAVSLGDTDSLACHPASTTHSAVPEKIRLESGITEGLVRISIGIEDTEDLIADFEQALEGL